MKLLGHPVHPMLIHFPTALLPMDFVLSLLYYNTGNINFGLAAFYCLVGAVLTGYIAMIAGIIDMTAIPPAQKTAMGGALLHGFINGLIIIIYTIIAYKTWQVYPAILLPTTATLIIKAILVITLFVGNYLGGRLIYKYFIGIDTKRIE